MFESVLSRASRLKRALLNRLRARRALAAARAASLRNLERPARHRVLVVCYGNIYRSAFVGELLRRELPPPFEIRSAGFHPREGRPVPPGHVEMSRALGVDLSAHRSALVRAEDVTWADWVVLMDRHNWLALDVMGTPAYKQVWLGSLLPGSVEIADPYAMDDISARRVLQRLHDTAGVLAGKLRSGSD